MNDKLAIVAALLRVLHSYIYTYDNHAALEALQEMRRIISKAELNHRRPVVIDPLSDDEGL